MVAQADQVGVEEAVRQFAADLHAGIQPGEIEKLLRKLRGRRKSDDAQAAYQLYEAYVGSHLPLHRRMLWRMMQPMLPSWVVESKPERVVLRSPSSKGRVFCPLIWAVEYDLERARPFCEALFRHDACGDPRGTLLVKALNPRLRWEMVRFRPEAEEPCHYAIVLGDS